LNKNLIILTLFLIVSLFLLSSCDFPGNKPIGAYKGFKSCSGSGEGSSVYSESSARSEARDNAFEDADSKCDKGTGCDGRITTSCSSQDRFGLLDDYIEYTCKATISGSCSATSAAS